MNSVEMCKHSRGHVHKDVITYAESQATFPEAVDDNSHTHTHTHIYKMLIIKQVWRTLLRVSEYVSLLIYFTEKSATFYKHMSRNLIKNGSISP